MLSSISTNPEMPSARGVARPSDAAPSTGAIWTRTSCPAGAVVTKFAIGARAPWRSRSWMLSSAWMIRLRSKMAKIERPRPDQAVRLPGGGRAVERLAQELHRARVVQQDAPLDVAHDHALRELRHQRRKAVALLLDALVRLAHALVEVLPQRFVGGGEAVEALGEPPDLRGAAQWGAVRGIRREHDPRVLEKLRRRCHVAAKQRPQDQRQRKDQHHGDHDRVRGVVPEHAARAVRARAR